MAGGIYEVAARVSLADDASKSSEGIMKIHVGIAPLVALIKGGNSIEASNIVKLVLDASKSNDPDVGPGEKQGLTYKWSCAISDGQRLVPCRDMLGTILVFDSQAIITVPPFLLAKTEEVPYQFTVQVSKNAKTPAFFTMPVWLSEVEVPRLSLQAEMGYLLSDGTVRMNLNSDSQFRVSSGCSISGSDWLTVKYKLSPLHPGIMDFLDFHGLSCDDFFASLTGDSKQIFDDREGSFKELITIEARKLKEEMWGNLALMYPGNTYTLTATCTASTSGASSQASINFHINSPPSGPEHTCKPCLLGKPGCVQKGNPIF